MTFVDQLRALRSLPQAVWLQFVGSYRDGCLDLYLFFEGAEDFSFYQPHLRLKWGERGKLVCFNCRGKDDVVGIMPRVKRALDKEWRALFFIDKDLDDLCGVARYRDEYLFETEWYSIENYIVAPGTFSVIWSDLLHLSVSDPRLAAVLRAFDAAYGTFVSAMKVVMSWIILLRRMGHRVVLNDVSMDNLVVRDGECLCRLKDGWESHIMAASNTHAMDYQASAVAAVSKELDGYYPKVYIRGKFELWFFVAFLSKVLSTVTERTAGEPRSLCRVTINCSTAMDILSARLGPPASLKAFMDRVLERKEKGISPNSCCTSVAPACPATR